MENIIVPERTMKEVIMAVESAKFDTSKSKHVFYHKYDVGCKVFIASFEKHRTNQIFSKIEESFEFLPVAGEIAEVIKDAEYLPKYRIKGNKNNRYVEENVFDSWEECDRRCKVLNRK